MNMLVSDEQPADLHEVDHGTVELLVSRPGAEALRFELAEGKATVGSSPSCQIRLDLPGVRPLQCLIVRKDGGLTVTRWAAGIQLNGLDFTTSQFNTGDILSIGDLRLELARGDSQQQVDEPSPVTLIDEVEARVAAEVAESEAPAAASGLQRHPYHSDLDRLRSANRQTKQRFRRLVDALRKLRNEARTLDQQVTSLTEELHHAQQTQEALRAELHQSQAIGAERESQIGEELDRAMAELTASYAKADEASREIESLRAQNQEIQEQVCLLTEELSSLRDLSHNYDADKVKLEQQLADRESQLAHVREELTKLQQQYESSVSELRGQNESLQEQVAGARQEHDREVADLRQGLEASVVELHEQNETLRNQLEELTSERDRQIAELQGLADSLRNEAAACVANRDQRIAELEGLQAELQRELASAVEARDRQLNELYSQCESLRHDAANAAQDRDQAIAELTRQFDARQAELSAIITDRERELQELRDGMRQSTQELRSEAESLAAQLAEQAAERDRAIAELAEVHQRAVVESARQIESLQQELATAEAERASQVAALETELERTRTALAESEQARSQPDPEKVDLESELQAIRAERQKLAEEKHHLVLQLEDAEKRSKLLEIDVRSVSAEWQRTQSTVTRLQDELLSAQAYAADLDAKLCDFQCSADIDRAADNDAYASNLAALRKELDERSEALATSQAECEQVRTQLTAAEQELSACRANIEQMNARVSALEAAAAESSDERARLEALRDERSKETGALREAAGHAEEALAAELTARGQQIAELEAQLSAVREELANAGTAGTVQGAHLADRVSELEAALAAAEAERTGLATTVEQYQAQVGELTATITHAEQAHAIKLADRDHRIAALTTELDSMQQSFSAASSHDETRHAELAASFAQIEQRLASELQAKEALIAEHAAELTKLQDAVSAELATRDAKIAELSTQLESLNLRDASEQSINQQACDDLRQQLYEAQQKAAAELSRREEQIAELARELHETQDQLADCAAQSERVAELYRQAQADLAAFTAQSGVLSHPDGADPTSEFTGESLLSAPADNTIACATDPRDDDEPRLQRALASQPTESEVDESATKTVPFQPTSFIDRYSHIFDEDADASEPQTPPRVATPAPQLENIDDDSAALEAYMANMMKRVRGESSSDSIAPPVPRDSQSDQAPQFSNPVARMSTLTERVAVTAAVGPEEAAEENLICLNELKQTSQKPPLPTSLSAMRELANISARQAIAKHRKRRHFEGALSKLLVSGIAGTTATYMLLSADSYLSPYFLAGCGVAVVSAYWGVKLLGILLEMIRDGINTESTPVELDESSNPLPIDGVPS